MYDLQIIDYKIMDFIDKREFTRLSHINLKFNVDCKERVGLLCDNDYLKYESSGVKETKGSDSSVISAQSILTGNIQLTENGKIALQDYKAKNDVKRKSKRWENIRWLITTLIAITALVNSILARLGL